MSNSNKTNKNTTAYQIARTNWYTRTIFNKLLKEEKINLTNEQWVVLKIICATPGISQTEIAKRSLKDKTNITRILDGLERKKYIIRKKDEKDRRIYNIIVTDEGKHILKGVDPIINKVEEIFHSSISKQDIENLKILLDKICLKMKEHL